MKELVCEHPKTSILIPICGLFFSSMLYMACLPTQNAWAAETKTLSGNYAVLDGSTLTFKHSDTEITVTADAVMPNYDQKKYAYDDPTPWHAYKDAVRKVVFDDSVKGSLRPTSTAFWFYEMGALESIEGMLNLGTSDVTGMVYMFSGCSSLTSLDLSGYDTSKVLGMDFMFAKCSSLTSIDVSGFDTSQVGTLPSGKWDMVGMFQNCSSLKSINLTSFDTSRSDPQFMFSGCSSLEAIYVGDLWSDGRSGKSKSMFEGCTSLAGGNGTTYDSSHIDGEYARVDTEDAPGYLTHSTPMYRLYNPNSGEHFYTSSTAERDNVIAAGWNDEGIGWMAPERESAPVYRLYNANGGEHHYTLSEAERDSLVAVGWSYEGVGWHSCGEQDRPLYREYNPNAFANNHNYTTSRGEHDHLVSIGWHDEGIAWYGI